ncbi:hypothetical protein BN2364_4032 [Alloalcanivorax xenomutans]|nr:hypothetical protein BN2364_4032 [Alloalcanivorax xenomutans]
MLEAWAQIGTLIYLMIVIVIALPKLVDSLRRLQGMWRDWRARWRCRRGKRR